MHLFVRRATDSDTGSISNEQLSSNTQLRKIIFEFTLKIQIIDLIKDNIFSSIKHFTKLKLMI